MRASSRRRTPKVALRISGLPLIAWVVRGAVEATSQRAFVVTRPLGAFEAIRAAVRDECCDVVLDACTVAAESAYAGIRAAYEAETVAILSGDTLVLPSVLRRAISLHRQTNAQSTAVVARQTHITDSEWDVIPSATGKQIHALSRASDFERVAWLLDRDQVLQHQDVLESPDVDGDGPRGFERGSINWLIESLRQRGVRTNITDILTTVVNVNTETDIHAATTFIRESYLGLHPGSDSLVAGTNACKSIT